MSENKDIEEKKDSEIVEKKKKAPKQFPASKLPGFFKKNFKADKIEKKLYKKIFVPTDRELVKSMFEENPEKPGYLYIPRDKMIVKSDFKRLKIIAKDVKSQKGSFKWLPFIAVVVFIAAVCIAFITFKNPLAKKGLTFAMQKAFGARTDIARVNVELFNATITINDLQQANRSSPMKNIFQIDKTEIKFDLTEALRGKFYAKNIEVSGLAIGTPRTYSGELSAEELAPNPAVEKMMAEINQKKDEAIAAAKASIEAAFAEYNPVNMIALVQDNLKSPALAGEVQKQVEDSVQRWSAKPDEMQKQVEDFTAEVNSFVSSANSMTNTDFSRISNPLEATEKVSNIKNMISQANSMMDKSKSMTNNVKTLVDDVKADSEKIKTISTQMQEALKADTALVNEQLNKITSFNLDTGTKILGNALDSAMYAVVGSYYPYIQQATAYAMELKAKASRGSQDEQKKAALLQPRHERLPGIDVYWKNDRVPKFLIENIKFSGLGIAVNGAEISSDMDKRGVPASLTASYQEGSRRTHNAEVVVDARSSTSNPLVGLKYSGNNYPFAFSVPYLNLDSNTTLNAFGSVDNTGAVSIDAKFNMGALKLTADEFEPAIGYRFYSSALEAIDYLVMGAKISIDANRRLSLKIDSDIDERFNSILKTVVNKELGVLIGEAKTQITGLLNDQCGGVMDNISQFIDIENGINAQSINMNKVTNLLEGKKGELEAKLKEQTSSSIGDALKDSGIGIPKVPVPSNGSEESNKAEDAIGGALKGLFKR